MGTEAKELGGGWEKETLNLDQESKMDYWTMTVTLLREGKGMKALGWEWDKGPWILKYNLFKDFLLSKKPRETHWQNICFISPVTAAFKEHQLTADKVNPEEPLLAVCSVYTKGLALVLKHLDLEYST